MKKFLISFLAVLILCFSALPVFAQEPANYAWIHDDAELMTFEEEQSLFRTISDVKTKHNVDVIILTTDYLWYGLSIEGVADAAFTQYGTGPDGAVFAICMSSREWTMQGYGAVREILSEDALDLLESDCIDLLSNGNYTAAFETFVSDTDRVITLYRQGTPYETPIPWGTLIVISLAVGFAIALIVVLVMVSRLKSVGQKSEAKDYIKQGSLNVTESRDLFLYHTVTRVPKPKNNSSGGSRSSGGGRSGKF